MDSKDSKFEELLASYEKQVNDIQNKIITEKPTNPESKFYVEYKEIIDAEKQYADYNKAVASVDTYNKHIRNVINSQVGKKIESKIAELVRNRDAEAKESLILHGEIISNEALDEEINDLKKQITMKPLPEKK